MNSQPIKDLIQIYFDANFELDAKKLASVFHDEGRIIGHDDAGNLVNMDRIAFIAHMEEMAKVTPQTPRADEIVAIDFTSERTAVARVKVRLGDVIYTDALNFIQIHGKWGVIAKIYAGSPV